MLEAWLQNYQETIKNEFGQRIRFIGLQGSQGRGEAKADSDIDVVLILDAFDYDDLERYRIVLDQLPEREKICGFVSGEKELQQWDKADLFQFYHDTLPLQGDLQWMEAMITRADIQRAMHRGACNLYHGCVHNALHGQSAEALQGMLKMARFVLQAKHYLETGIYVKTRAELAEKLQGGEVLALFGGLGMGKTAFTRGIAEGLGVDSGVSSPTFALVHDYCGRLLVHHFDMYRVSGWDDLYSTGFFDYLETEDVLVIEWSENIEGALPEDAIRISISVGADPEERHFEIEGIEL